MQLLQAITAAKDRCNTLASVDITNFSFSLLILVGLLLSYLPQHIRIIGRRSSFGLSPYFVLLGVTSATCTFANILVLPTSRADMDCCHQISGFACFAALLGVAQVGMQWICFVVILLLFLVFFPRATPSVIDPQVDRPPSLRIAIVVVGVCVVHGILTIILSFYFVLGAPQHQQSWANFLGVLAAILASIQYFPQIWTTYKLKSVESLSIPMMCIQTPGGFIWAASLASRLGAAGWSLWGVYVVTASLQGVLLVMGSIYEIRNRRREKKELQSRIAAGQNDSQITTSEESPLLRSAN